MRNLSTKFLAFLILGLVAWGCEDEAMEPAMQTNDPALINDVSKANTQAKPAGKTILSNISVTQTLADGSTFVGTLNITSLATNSAGDLLASGTLVGTVTNLLGEVTEITQTFTDITSLLSNRTRNCQILFLDLGPIFLDVLGLQIDLSQIQLDITAVGGAGNLLGNLLCALANLLNPRDGILDLDGITSLINQINKLL